MLSLATVSVLATESGIPYTSPLARLAVPLGILIFFGGPYLLLRSNLGTKRAYLVLFTSFFGYMIIQSLFWAFGAPGTPAYTGPTNLPGQVAEEYRPIWVGFAEDSTVAGQEPYASLVADEGAFSEEIPADRAEIVQDGVEETQAFFADEESKYQQVGETWAVTEGPFYALADNGRPVIRVTYGETFQVDPEGNLPEGVDPEQEGEIDPDGDAFTAYAFFDAGSPLFPSLIFVGLSVLLFGIHAGLLYADEQAERREAREAREVVTEEPARDTARV